MKVSKGEEEKTSTNIENLLMLIGVILIVTYRPIATQRLGKHILVEANARNYRTSIARQQVNAPH
jgi:hypothetical protein